MVIIIYLIFFLIVCDWIRVFFLFIIFIEFMYVIYRWLLKILSLRYFLFVEKEWLCWNVLEEIVLIFILLFFEIKIFFLLFWIYIGCWLNLICFICVLFFLNKKYCLFLMYCGNIIVLLWRNELLYICLLFIENDIFFLSIVVLILILRIMLFVILNCCNLGNSNVFFLFFLKLGIFWVVKEMWIFFVWNDFNWLIICLVL